MDYCISCWDADLRREGNAWKAYKLSGPDWQNDQLLNVAKNGYRVVLTRARKRMVIFVHPGTRLVWIRLEVLPSTMALQNSSLNVAHNV